MPDGFQHWRRYLRRLRTRLIAIRLLESAGISLAAAALLALPLIPLLPPAISPWTTSLVIAILAITIATIHRLLRLPPTLTAAIWADRQHHLHDLLSTAIAIDALPDSQWKQATLASANAVTLRLSPSSVILRKLGPRSWAAIALCVTCLTIILLITSPPSLQADPFTAPARIQYRPLAVNPDLPDYQSPLPQGNNNDPSGNPNPSTPLPPPDDSAQVQSLPSQHLQDRQIAGNSPGGGQSQTNSNAPPPAITIAPSQNPAENSPTGAPSIGSAQPNSTGAESPNNPTGQAVVHLTPATVAPWQSPNWAAAQSSANQLLQSNQIPPADREILRAYFNRRP